MSSKVQSAKGCCATQAEGFKNFLLRGNVVDLAVAVVVGGAFKMLIDSFVSSFITPLLGLIGSQDATNGLSFTIKQSTFNYGNFINALISFVIICVVIYFCVVVPLLGITRRYFPIRDCPECHCWDVPGNAKRCKYCCSVLPPLPSKSKGSMDEIVSSASTGVNNTTGAAVNTTGAAVNTATGAVGY